MYVSISVCVSICVCVGRERESSNDVPKLFLGLFAFAPGRSQSWRALSGPKHGSRFAKRDRIHPWKRSPFQTASDAGGCFSALLRRRDDALNPPLYLHGQAEHPIIASTDVAGAVIESLGLVYIRRRIRVFALDSDIDARMFEIAFGLFSLKLVGGRRPLGHATINSYSLSILSYSYIAAKNIN